MVQEVDYLRAQERPKMTWTDNIKVMGLDYHWLVTEGNKSWKWVEQDCP